MPRITLPDGSVRQYDRPVTAARLAADIGPRLAAAALGALIVARLAERQIGGRTGDVLGAAQVAAEIACLITLVLLGAP